MAEATLFECMWLGAAKIYLGPNTTTHIEAHLSQLTNRECFVLFVHNKGSANS